MNLILQKNYHITIRHSTLPFQSSKKPTYTIWQPHPNLCITPIKNLLHIISNTQQHYDYLSHTLKPYLHYDNNPATQPKLTDNIHTIEDIRVEKNVHHTMVSHNPPPHHYSNTSLKLIVTSIKIIKPISNILQVLLYPPEDINQYLPNSHYFIVYENPYKEPSNSWSQNWVVFSPKNIETLQYYVKLE